jgi:hypothetical protein
LIRNDKTKLAIKLDITEQNKRIQLERMHHRESEAANAAQAATAVSKK